MPRFILIDANSGFIWYDTTADTEVDACRKADIELGGVEREYETVGRLSGTSGYAVYTAPTTFPEIGDGTDEAMISAVSALGAPTFVAYRDPPNDE